MNSGILWGHKSHYISPLFWSPSMVSYYTLNKTSNFLPRPTSCLCCSSSMYCVLSNHPAFLEKPSLSQTKAKVLYFEVGSGGVHNFLKLLKWVWYTAMLKITVVNESCFCLRQFFCQLTSWYLLLPMVWETGKPTCRKSFVFFFPKKRKEKKVVGRREVEERKEGRKKGRRKEWATCTKPVPKVTPMC